MQPHGSSSADRNQCLAHLRDTDLSNAEIVLAAHRDLLPKRSVKHDAVSMSLLKEGMLAYHITAAITACIIIVDMAIPLTRANRLAAMRESDERITSILTPFLRGPLHFTYALGVNFILFGLLCLQQANNIQNIQHLKFFSKDCCHLAKVHE